jgi:glucokinase
MKTHQAAHLLAIEIGGTKLQIALGDPEGHIKKRWRAAVDRQAGADGIRDKIRQILGRCLRAYPRITSIGVGFGGPVNRRTEAIACSHQIGGWSDFPLADWLRQLTHRPVHLDNDANVAALGESICGAGQGADPVFYVTLGSGVGGGLVVNRAVYHGAIPGEAEIGHVRLNQRGDTVESQCSGWAVDRRLREHRRTHPGSRLSKLMEPHPGCESRCLVLALAEGHVEARRLLRKTSAKLALALSHVVHLMHPEVIVLGGGLALVGEPLRVEVEQALRRGIMDVFRPGPAVRLASLGEDAVPTGALLLAAQQGASAP